MKQILGLLIISLAALTASSSMIPNSTQVLEVRKGETVQLEVMISGDFVESEQATVVSLKAKEDLWMRVSSNQVEVSMDGVKFKPFKDVATGSLEVGSLNSSSLTTHLKIFAK